MRVLKRKEFMVLICVQRGVEILQFDSIFVALII